ncbi:MAG: DUF2442 domain-containing protein [Pseudomonadota bacterium]
MIPPIVCEQPDDVASVEALPGYRLRVRFHDGVSGTVDMSRRVHSPDAGVFAGLADASRFAQVAIRFGAVWWPGEVELDLAPDAMHDALRENGEWVLA